MPNDQTYKNHVRWYPLFHFVVMPLLLLNLAARIFWMYREPQYRHAWEIVLALTLLLLALAARLMVLTVQNRVIRLEERLRYQQLLAADVAAKACELPTSRIIALRFASDAELPDLVAKTLNGEFDSNKAIKTSIKQWRGDYLRA
ncbi:MAG: hypothetical protein JO053_05090 [Acidobacteria bacterium]|nr:hypothetical protein [Acidobacteriota bacterium]